MPELPIAYSIREMSNKPFFGESVTLFCVSCAVLVHVPT